MKTDLLPLFRATHLMPYLDLFNGIGVPVEHRMAKAGLPMCFMPGADHYLPINPTLAFLGNVARDEGIDDLAFRACQGISPGILGAGLWQAIRSAPSLKWALDTFFHRAHLEDSSVKWWIEPEAENVKLCSRVDLPIAMNQVGLSEWHNNLTILAIVRLFATPSWLPAKMAFRSNEPAGPFACNAFENTRILTGQKAAWITLPRSMLALPRFFRGAPRHLAGTPEGLEGLPSGFLGALDTCTMRIEILTPGIRQFRTG